jgi:MYXO-CTERM domain-containing protein
MPPATLTAQAAAVPEPGAASAALLSLAMPALRRRRRP